MSEALPNPPTHEQMHLEAAWLRSGDQQGNPTWLRARLKFTADLLDEGADRIAGLESAAIKVSTGLPVIAWQSIEPRSITYNKPFGGTKATPLCDQDAASARIAELEALLAKLPSDRERLLLEDSARLRRLLAESQAALSASWEGLAKVSLEARGLGNQSAPLRQEACGHSPNQPYAKALEFAEYVAKGAEQLLTSVNTEDAARMALDEAAAEDCVLEVMAQDHLRVAIGDRCEFATGLRSDIYEFRKRAEKVKSGQQGRMQAAAAERSDEQGLSACVTCGQPVLGVGE